MSDEFHDLQPDLLRLTFRPPNYPPEELFCGSDMNLYYDVQHHLRYKRPDWFAVVGVSRLYAERDLRLSYVMWQERVPPTVVVELLSPGTEKEDLGLSKCFSYEARTKWVVYEQILREPYCIVFDRYSDDLKAFALTAGSYQQIELQEPKIWMTQLQLGLGLWSGSYEGITRTWLRWYHSDGHWIVSEEKAVVEEQLQAERSRSQRLEELLRSQGIDPDSIT